MKRLLLVTTSLLVTAALAAAAPPEVPEKVEAKPGELTRFVVKAEKGKKIAFAPAFDEADCFVDRLFSDEPDTIRFLVQPRKGGTYVITFWTVGEGAYKQVRIKAGDPVPPPPPPPDPTKPDGALGVRKASRDGAALVPAFPEKADQLKALAGAARSTASLVAAGAAKDSAGQFSPELALAKWREANNGAVKGGGAWGPWATAASGRLAAVYREGRLPAQANWVDAFNEVAEGLEDVR